MKDNNQGTLADIFLKKDMGFVILMLSFLITGVLSFHEIQRRARLQGHATATNPTITGANEVDPTKLPAAVADFTKRPAPSRIGADTPTNNSSKIATNEQPPFIAVLNVSKDEHH